MLKPGAAWLVQVLELLQMGDCMRHVGETLMNKDSSRSHAIFRLVRREWHCQEARLRP